MARNHIKAIRAVHLTAECVEDKLVLSARYETKGSLWKGTLDERKNKLAKDLHRFLTDQGYNPLNIKFHKTRQ